MSYNCKRDLEKEDLKTKEKGKIYQKPQLKKYKALKKLLAQGTI